MTPARPRGRAMMMFGRRTLSSVNAYRKEPAMSTDRVRQANLAAITCEPRPHLPAGFRRHSNRLGASLGAARTGLSVYELPPGQAIGPYHSRCSPR
jgi:uncharacterized cupin superfamily protein